MMFRFRHVVGDRQGSEIIGALAERTVYWAQRRRDLFYHANLIDWLNDEGVAPNSLNGFFSVWREGEIGWIQATSEELIDEVARFFRISQVIAREVYSEADIRGIWMMYGDLELERSRSSEVWI